MTSTPSIAVVLGTRPEIIKCAPIVHECERRDYPYAVVHTGQHYSDELDSVFFEELDLPEPDYDLGVGSRPHGRQTGTLIAQIEPILEDERPDAVLVQGDTNSALAGSIAACKLDTQLGHVEAGLRSFDRDMPEELNRILADHASDYLFAPTTESERLLQNEGIPDERIHVTGNTVVDAVQRHADIAAEESDVLDELGISGFRYAVLTAHRAENVDDPDRFQSILDGVGRFAADRGVRCIYPVHPRAEKRIAEFDLSVPEGIELVDALSYLDFLRLEDEALVVFTDSGGVQEETCILGTRCVTVRDSTERPETLSVGANILVGTDAEDIASGAAEMLDRPVDWACPFGNGTAAANILDAVSADVLAEVA
ncbi:non-hydrolyzing UDP-N-acetylglucosamine 2-epimerase [Halorussus litoreus]|uniref:non-hydrolyzing UDP-N-acetylglucosamine 2-epimerase n=1 Tax=Halorussus litoreus TaxID=1710536 RepID=UPI000E224BCA|nr:UDP-N-acetylglucosamine 2-epimerase (non-hydrolyzing) [Halorussus litoreus]